MTRNLKRLRSLRNFGFICTLLFGCAGCGTFLDPFFLISYPVISVISATTTPREQLTVIGADQTQLYAMRADYPNPFPYGYPFGPVYVDSFPAIGSFDLEAISLATGMRSRIRSSLVPVYNSYSEYGGSRVMCDGRWLVFAGSAAELRIVDLATQQEQVLFEGLFNSPRASIACLTDGTAVVTSDELVLMLDLATSQPTWFTVADLGFIPSQAALSGGRLAVFGDPLFDPDVDPSTAFSKSLNLYVIDLPNGPPRLLREGIGSQYYADIRFGDNKVFWKEYNEQEGLSRVLSTDVVSGDTKVVLELKSYDDIGQGRSLLNWIVDFGPAGVLYQQSESATGDLAQPQDLSRFFTTNVSVRLRTLDGGDRELRSISHGAFPPIQAPPCGAAIYGPGIGVTLGTRLIGTKLEYYNSCDVEVYDGSTDSHNVISVQ